MVASIRRELVSEPTQHAMTVVPAARLDRGWRGILTGSRTLYYFASASYTNKVDLSSSGMKYARRPESLASTQTGFCVIGRPDGDHSSIGT